MFSKQKIWGKARQRKMVVEKGYHGYHMVERSPWPVVGASGALGVALGVIVYMHYRVIVLLIMGVVTVGGTRVVW